MGHLSSSKRPKKEGVLESKGLKPSQILVLQTFGAFDHFWQYDRPFKEYYVYFSRLLEGKSKQRSDVLSTRREPERDAF